MGFFDRKDRDRFQATPGTDRSEWDEARPPPIERVETSGKEPLDREGLADGTAERTGKYKRVDPQKLYPQKKPASMSDGEKPQVDSKRRAAPPREDAAAERTKRLELDEALPPDEEAEKPEPRRAPLDLD